MVSLSPTEWFSKKQDASDSIEAAMGRSGGGGPKGPSTDFPQPFLPSLSLVPESRISLLRRRRATKKAIAIGLISLAVLGVSAGGLVITLAAAKSSENAAVAEQNIAAAEVEALAPVGDLYTGFEERQAAVANALSSDIDYYDMVTIIQDSIQAEIPRDALAQDASGTVYVKSDYADIGLTSYSVQDGPCPSGEPFQPEPALGCFSGTATSSSYAAAGDAIAQMNAEGSGLFGGYILSVSDAGGESGGTTWTFTINFGSGALSGKYLQESQAILGDGDLASDDGQVPSPSASPSPSPITTEGGN